MGADGGVCWMALHHPSQYKRVSDLIKPFYFLTQYGNADWQEEANDAFRSANNYDPPNYLVGTYGSFQNFSIYDDLRQLLEPDTQICSNSSLTFVELVDDLASRPLMKWDGGNEWFYLLEDRILARDIMYYYYADCQHPSILEAMLWDTVDSYYSLGIKRVTDLLLPIADMRVCDWANELRSLLDYKKVYHEETWT